VVKTILTILLIIISIALTIIVLMQEGKNQGLSASIGGSAPSTDSYWNKNKGRSKDAMIVKATAALTVLFFVITLVLSSKWM